MRGTHGSGAFPPGDSQIELLRTVVLCHPGWASLRGITFAPDMRSSPPWVHWKETILLSVLLPAMEGAQRACVAGDCRALPTCDDTIDSALPAGMREASRLAGARLMEGYSPPRSEKCWARYRALLMSGEVSGHLVTVCALRATAFHLSPTAMMSAYIFLEARGGLPLGGIASWVTMVGDCLNGRHGLKNSNLRAA